MNWDINLFEDPSDVHYSEALVLPTVDIVHPARIHNFLCHSVYADSVRCSCLLVYLSWYKCHPKVTSIGKPVTIWYERLFEPFSVQLITCHSVSLNEKLDGETVLFVCPCINV